MSGIVSLLLMLLLLVPFCVMDIASFPSTPLLARRRKCLVNSMRETKSWNNTISWKKHRHKLTDESFRKVFVREWLTTMCRPLSSKTLLESLSLDRLIKRFVSAPHTYTMFSDKSEAQRVAPPNTPTKKCASSRSDDDSLLLLTNKRQPRAAWASAKSPADSPVKVTPLLTFHNSSRPGPS